MQNDAIHDAVKERYGTLARSVKTVEQSCCGDSASAQATSDCGCNVKLYDDALLEGLPVDVTGLSLG